jgi:hypothetical protein
MIVAAIDALLSPANLRDLNMTADGLVKMR